MAGRGFLWGVIVGFFTGFCLGLPIFIIGGLIGVIWGIGLGARFGLLTGALIAAVTFRYFYPLKVEQREIYQRLCLIVCPMVVIILTFSHLAGGSFYLSILPALIAGGCAILLGHFLARWYLSRSLKNQ